MASLEEQVLGLLKSSQAAAAVTRDGAASQLNHLKTQEGFAAALATIGAYQGIDTTERLAALIQLKQLVDVAWSPSLDDYAGVVLVSDPAKAEIRERLLGIVYDGNVDSKITSQTAAVVAKIAKVDFPEEWPTLLDSVLGQLGHSNDDQVHALLVVLGELLSDSFDEDQFYQYANSLIGSLHQIAVDGTKKLLVRAHAVNIFRQCFDFVENLKEKEEESIASFSKGICDAWSPFFLQVVKEPMPTLPTLEEEDDNRSEVASHWRGVVALKIQVLLTLARIQVIFADLMDAQQFFEASWGGIQAHTEPYFQSYVNGDRQGGLINQYSLQYTLDFLVIEEIDYLKTLLEAPLVKQHLNGMREADVASGGNNVSTWIASVLRTLITFSSITKEAEEMWDIDFNVFLSEETFAETNNSPRSVCAGFVWQICAWFPKETLEGLLGYIKAIFHDASSSWRLKEAALFTLQQVAEEFENEHRTADVNAVRMCIEYTHPAMSDPQQYLRARGHITMAATLVAWIDVLGPDHSTFLSYAHMSLNALDSDTSNIVKTACIRIMRDYLTTLPSPEGTQLQPKVVESIGNFLESQDFDDMEDNVDLIDVVLQTLRDTIMANPSTCLDHNALDVLLLMVKYGAARDNSSSILIDEAFESAAEAMAAQRGDAYARLCHKVLPALLAAFDVEDPTHTEKTALTDVSASILKILAESAVEPLPQGFIAAAMPRLFRLIFADVDFYLCQSATLTIKHMLINDKDQVFNFVDPQMQKNGLEMCFMAIARLLGPNVDDASAAEVGELALTIVEKADPATLGSTMHELLQVIASRLATAQHYALIQSLSMVFARLSLLNAADTISFLADLPLGTTSALVVVLQKWLEAAGHFAGFEAIRQNALALVSIYRLHDPRVAAVTVHGDMVPDLSSHIRTRSMARNRPIEFTTVPAPLKIIKLLVNELVPYGDPNSAFQRPLSNPGLGATAKSRRDSDDEWESDDEDGAGAFGKGADDQTQGFLVDFFKEEGADPRFQELYALLSAEEKKRTVDAVEQRARVVGPGACV